MKINNILGDRIGYVELLDSMGNDLSIVNAARVSFNKQKTEFDEKDERLIKYLIKHKHYSPFRSVVFQFRVKLPLFVARQWYKHTIASSYVDSQLSWNEVSFRYVDASNVDYYLPVAFRQQATDNKQGSEGFVEGNSASYARHLYKNACEESISDYHELIRLGVCREQARGILPTSIYTSFLWTTSLQAVMNFLVLRKGEGAQSEIVMYAEAIEKLVKDIVPVTFKYWN